MKIQKPSCSLDIPTTTDTTETVNFTQNATAFFEKNLDSVETAVLAQFQQKAAEVKKPELYFVT